MCLDPFEPLPDVLHIIGVAGLNLVIIIVWGHIFLLIRRRPHRGYSISRVRGRFGLQSGLITQLLQSVQVVGMGRSRRGLGCGDRRGLDFDLGVIGGDFAAGFDALQTPFYVIPVIETRGYMKLVTSSDPQT